MTKAQGKGGRTEASRLGANSTVLSAVGASKDVRAEKQLSQAAECISQFTSRIGTRLRDLRRTRKLSIPELARLAGVSVGMISQIERGKTNPSLRTMEALRGALAVPLTSLLEPDKPERHLAKKREFIRRLSARPSFRVGEMTKQLLSPHGEHEMQILVVSLPAGSAAHDVLLGKGEKAGLVLSGSVVLTVAGRREALSTGDSFQFRSTLPHSVHNEEAQEATFLWITSTIPAKPPL